MEIDELTVMQDNLRHLQIDGMIEFVRGGGFWTVEALTAYAEKKQCRVCPLIELSKFPDGRFMVHDGHHRVVATYLGGRGYLRIDEYRIKEWKYEDYMSINFDLNYITPFDPRKESRLADISAFKRQVAEIIVQQGSEAAVAFIHANKRRYCQPRLVSGVSCLANRYLDRSAVFC